MKQIERTRQQLNRTLDLIRQIDTALQACKDDIQAAKEREQRIQNNQNTLKDQMKGR